MGSSSLIISLGYGAWGSSAGVITLGFGGVVGGLKTVVGLLTLVPVASGVISFAAVVGGSPDLSPILSGTVEFGVNE